MAKIAPLGKYRGFDASGQPLAGGLLYTYEAGTNTPKATFTDAGGLTANANPVVLDSEGYANIWLGSGSYKFVLKDTNDITQFTTDDIDGETAEGFGAVVTSKSSSFSLVALDKNTVFICTSALTISLLSAASAGEGFVFVVKNASASSNVTIDPYVSETIDGSATLVLQPSESATIFCNGTTWFTSGYYDVLSSADNTFTGTNTFEGETVFQDVIDVTNVNAETSAGGDLRTSGGTSCLAWGAGGSANLTAGGNLSMATTHKIVNCADPSSAQDVATKAYVESTVSDAAPAGLVPVALGRVNQSTTSTVSLVKDIGIASASVNGGNAGDFTVTLDNAMSDSNYLVMLSVGGQTGNFPYAPKIVAQTTTTFRVYISDGNSDIENNYDSCSFVIYGTVA